MKMKRVLALTCATVLLLNLAACGDSEQGQESSSGEGTVASEEGSPSSEETASEEENPSSEEAASEEAVSYSEAAYVSVESDLYGTGFTDGGTCIPRESEDDVVYDESTSAVMTVMLADGSAADASLIDTSNAYVRLSDGDGYYTSDFDFVGTALEDDFADGTLTYQLHDGDLSWINDPSYEVALGGMEWSAQGGDGNGTYVFNLAVCGITYDGEELAPAYFRATIYIYGREFSQDEATWGVATINRLKFLEPAKVELSETPEVDAEPVWTWTDSGAGYDEPILCDFPQENYDNTDNFYISWPSDVDASALTAEDITITLTGKYTDVFPEDQYTLTANTEMVTLENGEQMPDGDYSVFADADTTQIAVNMVYWPYTPVYTTMTITVNCDHVEGYDGTLTQTYDIASVYTYRIQTGGGTNTDGTVTCQAIYGVENIESITLDELANIGGAYSYSHSDDGVKSWLIENSDGTYTVTDNEEEATVYDFTDPQLLGHTLYSTQWQVKVEVDGSNVTYKMAPTCTVRRADPATTTLVAIDGYALSQAVGGWGDHMNWPWLNFINAGWCEEE